MAPLSVHLHSAQFGFLQERYLVQALGALERAALRASGLHPYAAVLFCDLRNAFGSIHRGFLRAVLVAMNIPPTLLAFVDAVLKPSLGHVSWRGEHFTTWTLATGVPQGGRLSAWLFVIGMNVHLQYVHNQIGLHELQLGYADDLAYLLAQVASLLARYKQLELLRLATGLTLKPSKCVIMPIGSASCEQWRASLITLVGADHPLCQFSVQDWAIYLGVRLSRGPSFRGTQKAEAKFEERSACILALGYGTPRTMQLLRVLSVPILRHALSCSGVTPELRKTWQRVMRMCLPGLSGVGPVCYHVRELFGWPTNAESLDSLAVRAAGSVLPRVSARPTHELRALQGVVHPGAGGGPSTHPLAGWLRYGAWQAWADALTTFRELEIASWTRHGYEVRVDTKVSAIRVLARHVPTLAAARDFAVRRIVQLWDGVVPSVLRFAERAIHAIRAVAQHGCPAESAAVLKLLTKHRELPLRDGQHTCCFCGCRHFYSAVPTTVMQGCYRSELRKLSDFRWLAQAPVDEWHWL
eukprot:6491127-Amphidinium_carterae.1